MEPLLLFAVFFGPLAFGSVEPWSLAILETTVLAFALGGKSRWRAPGSGPLWAMGFILLLGLGQWLNPAAPWGPSTWRPFTASAAESGSTLLLWSIYALLLWKTPALLAEPEPARRFLWALFAIGFLVAVIGLIQQRSGRVDFPLYGLREVSSGHSPFGPYFNRAHAASLLAVASAVGGGLLLASFFRFLRESADGARVSHYLLAQMIPGAMLATVLIGLVRSQNRGALLSLGAAVWLVLFQGAAFMKRPQVVRLARGLLLLLPAAAALMIWAPAGRSPLLPVSSNSVPVRAAMYRGGLDLWRDHPVWGVGPGGLIAAFPPYREPIVVGLVDHLHNDWLEFLTEEGAAGAAALLLGLLCLALRARRTWLSMASRRQRCLMGGALTGVLAFALHGLVDFSFHIPANAVIFLCLLSWVDARSWLPQEPMPRSRWAAGAAAVAGLALTALALPPAVAWSFKRQALSGPLSARSGLFQRAYLWDMKPQYLSHAASSCLIEEERGGRPCGAAALRADLRLAERGLMQDPLSLDLRFRQSELLRRLGRSEDAF